MKKLLAIALLLVCQLALAGHKTGSGSITVRPGSGGDPTTGFLPAANDSWPNWANAGLVSIGGRPTRSTNCTTLNPIGGHPNGSTDDVGAINSAISGCTAGQVVLLNPGSSNAINISLSGTTLTLNSGTLAIGMTIGGAGIQPFTMVTSGSGTSWVVSYGPAPGSTVSSQAAVAYVSYNRLASEVIQVNKGVTLRGGGNCTTNTTSPYCQTIINTWDGVLPDWSISSSQGNAQCGVTTATFSGCSQATAAILMGANGNSNFGWGGCTTGGSGTAPTGCGHFLAADVAQGATTVQLDSTSSFSVGQVVLIDELPALTSVSNPVGGTAVTTVSATSDFLTTTAAPATNRTGNPDSSGGTVYAFSLYPNRVNAELHKVTAVGTSCPGAGCTLTFDKPITVAFRQSGGHNSQVFWPTNCCATTYTPFITQAGVENMSIGRGDNSQIQMEFCESCWVVGVEGGMFVHGGVQMSYTFRSWVSNVYLHLSGDAENNGTEYPLAIDAGSQENLVDNCILHLGGKGMVSRAAGGGNVMANCYVDKTFYMSSSIGNAWMDMGLNASHYSGSHQVLFEGNWAENCDNDETHGSSTLITFFRNYCTGVRTAFTDPSTGNTSNDAAGVGQNGGGGATTPGPLRAAGPMGLNYWDAYVGNVLGLVGTSTTANGWTYSNPYAGNSGGGCTSNNSTKAIWMSGWVGSEWPCVDVNLKTSASPQFLFKNGNYDTVNAASVDAASGFSQAFPNSFFLTSAPAYFTGASCTYTWPWVTPAGSPVVKTNSCSGSGNPAKYRFDNGTPFFQP